VSETIPSPMCLYEPHCGHQAALSEPTVVCEGRVVHRDVRCLQCGRNGNVSIKVAADGH
jgi:hypothetical protein